MPYVSNDEIRRLSEELGKMRENLEASLSAESAELELNRLRAVVNSLSKENSSLRLALGVSRPITRSGADRSYWKTAQVTPELGTTIQVEVFEEEDDEGNRDFHVAGVMHRHGVNRRRDGYFTQEPEALKEAELIIFDTLTILAKDPALAFKNFGEICDETCDSSGAASIDINDLQKDVHEAAIAHGWWEEKPNLGELCMRLTMEVAELAEVAQRGEFEYPSEKAELCMKRGAEELTDIAMLCMDIAESRGVDLGEAIRKKLRYNETRPPTHGGKTFRR